MGRSYSMKKYDNYFKINFENYLFKGIRKSVTNLATTKTPDEKQKYLKNQ